MAVNDPIDIVCSAVEAAGASEIARGIDAFTACVPPGNKSPHLEMEPDGTEVSLRWFNRDRTESVTATFFGGKRIFLTFSSLLGDDMPSRELNLDRKDEITALLADPAFASVMRVSGLV